MKQKKMNKKAQITVFIILGILMLIISAVVMYVRLTVEKSKTPVELTYKVPQEAQPVHDYITQCMRDLTKEALIILGEHGGYIYPEEYGISGNFVDPTEANGLTLTKFDDYTIPYYWYMTSDNDCTENCEFKSDMPPLKRASKDDEGKSIESQIDKYIEENLPACTGVFGEFKKQGFTITQESEPQVTTSITNYDVTVSMDYPLKIERGGITVKIDEYIIHTPSQLMKIYELANEITQQEIESAVFEAETATLIGVYGQPRKDKLPPIASFSFDGNAAPLMWNYYDVKQKLTTIIMSYTPIVRVGTTLNDYPPMLNRTTIGGPAVSALMFNMRLETNKTYPLRVNFNYFSDWDPYVKVKPSNGVLIKAEEDVTSDFLRLLGLGMTRYDFKYDISYPVLVRISDPYAFNEEGYDYVFGLEANLRNNQPITPGGNVDIRRGANSGSFACLESQKVSGNITVNVLDANTSKPLEGVQVYYNFGEESCYIGETILDSNNQTATVTGRYPKGIGNILLKKGGYLTATKLFAVKENKVDAVTISMYPMKEQKVKLYIKDLDKHYVGDVAAGWVLNPSAYSPTDNFNMVVLFERIPDSKSNQKIVSTVILTDGSDPDNLSIKIAPGDYKVKIIVMDQENTTIPATRECAYEKQWWEGGGCGQWIEINETKIPISTTMDFNESTPVSISAQSLYNQDSMDVYGLYVNLKGVQPPENRVIEDLQILNNLSIYVRLYGGQLRPR